jgi:hypothetical protein
MAMQILKGENMNEFNFKSAICTSRVQSERLLALGLKKETADIVHYFSQCLAEDWTIVPLADGETARYIQGLEIPAWSLHRLLMMLDSDVQTDGRYISLPNYGFVKKDNIYDNIIDCIEWLIKEGYFPKEYLV